MAEKWPISSFTEGDWERNVRLLSLHMDGNGLLCKENLEAFVSFASGTVKSPARVANVLRSNDASFRTYLPSCHGTTNRQPYHAFLENRDIVGISVCA